MIHSMTGYGKADAIYQGKKIHVEVKSLNSKAMDLSVRMPSLYREKELEVRKAVSTALVRGKVEVNVWVEKGESHNSLPINESAVGNYWQQLQTISTNLSIPAPTSHVWEALLRLPEVISQTTIEELTDEEWQAVSTAVETAITRLIDFRKQEGAALQTKLAENIANITRLMQAVEAYEETRVEKIKQRLLDRLSEIKEVEYDRNRFEQELIYYIEKLDINEEKQRLSNHLAYFINTMDTETAQGKKLGFIAQEMGREINTTGSKSNQAEMQQLVVQMKDELEQIKEQVLNVL